MDFSLIIDSLPIYFSGLWTTIWLVALALISGLMIAIPLAVARNTKNPLIYLPAWGISISSAALRYWFSCI